MMIAASPFWPLLAISLSLAAPKILLARYVSTGLSASFDVSDVAAILAEDLLLASIAFLLLLRLTRERARWILVLGSVFTMCLFV